jgi:hypothetical protein
MSELKLNQIIDRCVEQFKKKAEAMGLKPSVSPDSVIMDIFPENKDATPQENMMTAESNRLEVMVDLELEFLESKFRLNCNVFFDPNLTIKGFAELLLEASQKSTDEDDSVEKKFQRFFDEAESSEEAASDSEDSEETDGEDEDA